MPWALIRERLKQWLEMQPPDHFRLIKPDQQLARIVDREMQAELSLAVKTVPEADLQTSSGAIPVVLSASSKKLGNLAPLNDASPWLSSRDADAVSSRHSLDTGRHCVGLAAIAQACAHDAHVGRIRSRLPGFARHRETGLAKRTEGSSGRGLRFADVDLSGRLFPCSDFPPTIEEEPAGAQQFIRDLLKV
jgi:hypothetical protein